MKSAVEYLYEMWRQDNIITPSMLEQAKEMEREQLAKAELEGSDKAVAALWKVMNNRD